MPGLEQSVTLSQPQHQALPALPGGFSPQVWILNCTALALWYLGYPERALMRMHEALHLAQDLSHPNSLASALSWAAWLHLERGDGYIAQERADATVALSSEYGFLPRLALGTVLRGAALIAQEQWMEGIAQVRQVLEAFAIEGGRTFHLARLAAGYRGAGQVEDGLATVVEALRLAEKNDEHWNEAELYRLTGSYRSEWENGRQGEREKRENRHSPIHPVAHSSPEQCFQKAIDIARKQQAKSLELRAVMSVSRLWQQQGKKQDAHGSVIRDLRMVYRRV